MGDVHGCSRSLKKLIDKLPLDHEDRIVFIGDYIDRGPDSRDVIDFLIALSANHNCIFIRGNHEQMLLDYLAGNDDGKLWVFNGMRQTVDSYGGLSNLPDYHLDFFKSTQFVYEFNKWVFVHAGVRPGVNLKGQNNDDLIWIREEFIYSPEPLKNKTVVFGHTPFFTGPLIHDSKIGIDTGCVYGGKLTALRMDDMKLYHQGC